MDSYRTIAILVLHGAGAPCRSFERQRTDLLMDLLLINGHRQVPGYLPGSNLGMMILLQLARKKGYTADMMQDYVGNIVRTMDRMAEEGTLPRVMGFYTDFNNITWSEKLIRHVKEKKSDLTVIVGGPQSAGLDGAFLERTGADVLCPGEGEESLMELLDYYLRGVGELSAIRGVGYLADGRYISIPQRQAKKDLDDIPWPDLSLTKDYSKLMFPILSGRGCPMGCTFCYEGANSKNVRYASCGRVLEEIRRRAESDPTLKYLNFLDDTFTLDAKRVYEISDGIAELRKTYDFVWFASAHVDTVLRRPGMIRRMVDSGLKKLFFGFESGSDAMLKRFNKHITRQMILDVVAQCRDEGLPQMAGNFILGGPFEDEESLHASEDLVERLLQLAPGQVDTSYFSFLPYPNTPITTNPAAFGMEIYHELEDYCLEDIPLSRTQALSYEELMWQRLIKNYSLQKRMRTIYEEGLVPETVILETYRDNYRYHIYSKWMEYVYSRYPVDDAYWRMRALEGFVTLSEARQPLDCFVQRTFEIWDYYDTDTHQLMKEPMDGLPLALLKLCSGKYRLREMLDKLAANGWEPEAVMRTLRSFDAKKWVLFTEI